MHWGEVYGTDPDILASERERIQQRGRAGVVWHTQGSGQARRVLPVRVFLLDVLEDIGVGLLLPVG